MTWLPFVNPFFLVFWSLPPIFIFLVFRRKKRNARWALFLAYVLVGWVCVNLGIWLYYKSLGWLINATENPPSEWVEAWISDGAKRAFGLFFGWVYAIVYFTFWLGAAWIIKAMMRPLAIVVGERPN